MKRLHKELFRNWVNTRYEVDKKNIHGDFYFLILELTLRVCFANLI